MLKAIAQGETDTQTLAELAKGRLRRKLQELKQALFGQLRSHHRFLISNHLTHLDFLEEQMAVFDAQISEHIRAQTTSGQLEVPNALLSTESTEQNLSQLENLPQSWEQALVLLDTIPGVGRQTAELLLAEIGMDMSRFKSAAHLAKWAKLCPGNHESAPSALLWSNWSGQPLVTQWFNSSSSRCREM